MYTLIDLSNYWFGTNENDEIKTENDDDIVFGFDGNDNFILEGGNDTGYGGNGVDHMQGMHGNDTLFGGNGNDNLHGQNDIDKLFGGADNDKLYGGRDDDHLYGGTGNDNMYGGQDNDRLFGGAGNDFAYGGEGNDVIDGGDGVDHLFGGSNGPGLYGDILTGGADMDLFYFNHGDSGNGGPVDIITDFTSGEDLMVIDADPAALLGLDAQFSDTPGAEIIYEHTTLMGYGDVTMVHVRDDFGFGADNSIALLGHMDLTEADFFVY